MWHRFQLKRRGLPIEKKTWVVEHSDLEFDEAVGKGNYGTVFQGTYFGTTVAIKKIDDDDRKYLEREVAILKDIRHPNIVQLMGVCNHSSGLYLVTEYLNNGHLRKTLKNKSIELPWAQRVNIALDIALALVYLHSKNIIHRDLKSKNILLDKFLKVKLCDFGLARTVADSQPRRMTVCGTEDWLAPEVARGRAYNEKCDVFSFGIVLFEMIFRQKPNEDAIQKSLHTGVDFYVIRQCAGKDVPPAFLDLACEACALDLSERPPMRVIVQRLKEIATAFEHEALAVRAAEEEASGVSTSVAPSPPPGTPMPPPAPPVYIYDTSFRSTRRMEHPSSSSVASYNRGPAATSSSGMTSPNSASFQRGPPAMSPPPAMALPPKSPIVSAPTSPPLSPPPMSPRERSVSPASLATSANNSRAASPARRGTTASAQTTRRGSTRPKMPPPRPPSQALTESTDRGRSESNNSNASAASRSRVESNGSSMGSPRGDGLTSDDILYADADHETAGGRNVSHPQVKQLKTETFRIKGTVRGSFEPPPVNVELYANPMAQGSEGFEISPEDLAAFEDERPKEKKRTRSFYRFLIKSGSHNKPKGSTK